MIIIIIIILILIILKKEKIYEKFKNLINNRYYDCIISINVHEKFDFLMNQLKNIDENVNLSYAVILNCNDNMFDEIVNNAKRLPKNVFINDTILNKRTYHGSLSNGIYNNMKHAIYNLEFNDTFENIKYKKILHFLYEKTDRILLLEKMRHNKKLEKYNDHGFKYYENLNLSIQDANGLKTFTEICLMVEINKFNMEIQIKKENNEIVNFKI